MTLPTLKLEVDPTGTLPANKRVLERHTVTTRSTRVIKPDFSPYFTESMLVYSATGTTANPVFTLLTHGVDYSFVELYEGVTKVTGKEVCRALLIHRASLPDDFALTYQALGGPQNIDYKALAHAVGTLNQSGQPVDWNDITDKPTGFPPGPHLHDSQDVYGLEYLVENLRAMVYSVQQGSDASEKDMLENVAKSRHDALLVLRTFFQQLDEHFYDWDNPHGVTKGQIQLGSVENRHFVPKVVNGQPVENYASPRTTFNIIKGALLGDILKHIDDHRNPHEVTKTQIGLPLVQNFTMGVASDITATVPPADKYVSPLMVAEATPVLVGGILGHVADHENPHNLTKAQIGLGNVENFPMAADTEVLLGVSAERYMTPANIKLLTDNYRTVGNAGQAAHIANINNPHQVDKTDVGLSNVANYGLATSSDVRFGFADDLYITPLVLKTGLAEGFAAKMNKSIIDAADGAVPLDANSQVPARLLVNVPDYLKFNALGYAAQALVKDQAVLQYVFTRPVTIPGDFAGSEFRLATGGTDFPTTIELRRGVNTLLGHVIFQSVADVGAETAKVGTVRGASAAEINFATGEVLTLHATMVDADARTLSMSIAGEFELAASSNPGNGLMPTTIVRPTVLIFSAGRDDASALVAVRDRVTIASSTIVSTALAGDVRQYGAAFGNSFKGLIIGGKSDDTVVSDKYESIVYATDAIATAVALGSPRYSMIAFGNENMGVALGGITSADSLANGTNRYYYPTNVMSVAASLGLTMSRTQGYGTASNGFVRGGSTLFAEFNGSTYFGKYNYAASTLTVVSTASTLSRFGASAAGNQTVGIMAGGSYEGNPLTTVQRHLYATDALSAGTALGDARAFGAGSGDATTGFFAGGVRSTGVVVDTATKYTYADDTTATATVLSAARQHFTALSSVPGWR